MHIPTYDCACRNFVCLFPVALAGELTRGVDIVDTARIDRAGQELTSVRDRSKNGSPDHHR
jgi:hypothetical protein